MFQKLTPSSPEWWQSNDNIGLAAVGVLAISLWFAWKFMTGKTKLGRLPPGPLGLPLVGNIPFLPSELHTYCASLAQRYGPILTIRIGQKIHIVVTSAAVAREVLKDNDIIFATREPTVAGREATYGGSDILWLPYGPDWRMLRKVCARELLSNASLDSLYVHRRAMIRKTIKSLYGRVGSPVNVRDQAKLAIHDVMTRMLWGGQEKGEEMSSLGMDLRRVMSEMMELTGKPNVSDYFPGLARFDLQGIQKEMKGLVKQFDLIFDEMINQRLKMDEQESSGVDFLHLLLKLTEEGDPKTPLTMTHIKALLLDFILAGSETTSSPVESAMAEMLNQPELMRKAQQEVEVIVGKDRIVEESNIHKFPYLYAVMKEALRLHPPGPFLAPHCPSESCTVANYTIPKGALVLFNVWAIHRDPSVWKNPLIFDPERFLMNSSKWDYTSANAYYLFPFGSGRRTCLGIATAERMFVFLVASLVHSFDWKLPSGEREKLDLSDKFGVVNRLTISLVAIPTPRLSNPALYK